MKRVISLILSIAMLASLCTGLAITGYAEGFHTDYTHTLYCTITGDDEVTIGKGSYRVKTDPGANPTGDLVIPATITVRETTYRVTSIEEKAFESCSGLTSVIIPDSVVTIGDKAFNNCTSLTSVTILGSVTSIGNSVFYGCKVLTNIEIPNSVTSIGENAFDGCVGLTSITIPDSVTSIGQQAFYGCTGLTNIVIPSSVKNIGNSAFYQCTSLTNVTIPDSVVTISDQAFNKCTGLTSVTIPDSVKTIGQSIFSDCTSLTDVTIGSGITSIENQVFYNCTGLTSVTVEAITPPTLGSYVFYNCNLLEAIYVPAESVNAYKSATNWSDKKDIIKAIVAPSFAVGSTFVADSLNYKITSVEPKTVEVIASGTDYTSDYPASSYAIPVTVTNDGIEYRVTSIGEDAFFNCKSLENIIISEGVTSIGEQAFQDCESLERIEIPSSVLSIGKLAFNGCEGLASATFLEGLTSIGEEAFHCCYNLGSITIPNSVISIGQQAFYGCTGLTSVTIGSGVTQWGLGAFGECPITSLTLCDGLKSTGIGTFVGTSLTEVTIPASVITISDMAFYQCTNLTSVYIKAVTPPELSGDTFEGCNLAAIYVPTESVNVYKSATNWSDYESIIQATAAELPISFDFDGNAGCVITSNEVISYRTTDDGGFENSTENEGKQLTLEKGNFYTISTTNGLVYINYVTKDVTITPEKDSLEEAKGTAIALRDILSSTNNANTSNYALDASGNGKVVVPNAAYSTFNTAITNADDALKLDSPTQMTLDEALVSLNKAQVAFLNSLRANTHYKNGNGISYTDLDAVFSQYFEMTSVSANRTSGSNTYYAESVTLRYSPTNYSIHYTIYKDSNDEAMIKQMIANETPSVDPQTPPVDPQPSHEDPKPIKVSQDNGKFNIQNILGSGYNIHSIYYTLGTSTDDKDYFGYIYKANNPLSEVPVLGNGVHTFKIYATKDGVTGTYSIEVEAEQAITDPIAVKQNGVVFINFNGTTPSKISYVKGQDTIYIPIEDKIKLDATEFNGVETIKFDETDVTIK